MLRSIGKWYPEENTFISNDSTIVCTMENVKRFDGKTTISQELFMFPGLQLPEALNNLDSNIVLHQSNNIVNNKL